MTLDPGISRQGLIKQLDPMTNRSAVCTGQMRLASDIGGNNYIWLAAFQCVQLVIAQLTGERRLRNGISTGRSAAQVGVCNRA